MKNIQNWVLDACTDLDLEFHLNPTIEFANGKRAVVPAFIPRLGAKTGTIVMGSIEELREIEEKIQSRLHQSGYGFSVLWAHKVAYNRQATIKMFSEWGWGGSEKARPCWMIDIEYDEDGNSLT